ncbi:MAG TPA: Smr/MutS family protein [Steroidobacteraceae bacterium]|nr:Smr/MutS family protein [Steroidobacteraceae bacterium]
MSGKRVPEADEAEAQVFREAVSDVKPLPQRKRVPPAPRKPPARARFTAADRAMVLVESLQGFGESEILDSGDEISFRRDGIQDRVMRRLKRGEYRVEDVCDLHGLRVDEAKAALREFLAEALARQLTCVRIIHGKGNGSGNRGPVLKTAVNMILRKTGPVLAFTSARRVDGGTGAINVLLGVI